MNRGVRAPGQPAAVGRKCHPENIGEVVEPANDLARRYVMDRQIALLAIGDEPAVGGDRGGVASRSAVGRILRRISEPEVMPLFPGSQVPDVGRVIPAPNDQGLPVGCEGGTLYGLVVSLQPVDF